jgi:dimeric dUTPase (all-alpha-NTP-PPase superfamily)
MDLEKMLSMQKELNEKIIKEKGLEGEDLFPNTVLALQVELAEFANKGRWFKHWSNDRAPREFVPNHNDICEICNGQGMLNSHLDLKDPERKFCNDCDGCGVHFYNPLLEEFVDGVHFFLSIAIQRGWENALWIYAEQLDPDDFDGDLTSWYLEMIYFLNKAYMEKDPKNAEISGFQSNEYYFRIAWMEYLNLGINGFSFTPEQIEKAYMNKNAINHKRQKDGY